MIIIKTKYLAPTNTQGARIKATANGFSATIPFPYGLVGVKIHYSAVIELNNKHELDWDIDDMGYGSDDGGYYFTFNNSVVN
tara:strand:+ start:221 stop:466 length:246 start_codon:yes stop_codon:yes gene_type:complete